GRAVVVLLRRLAEVDHRCIRHGHEATNGAWPAASAGGCHLSTRAVDPGVYSRVHPRADVWSRGRRIRSPHGRASPASVDLDARDLGAGPGGGAGPRLLLRADALPVDRSGPPPRQPVPAPQPRALPVGGSVRGARPSGAADAPAADGGLRDGPG